MLFAIYSEDRDDGLPIRKANRDAHLAYASRFNIIAGGPILNDAGDMVGSMLIMDLPSQSAAEEFAANDPYTLAGLPKLSRQWPWKQTVGSVEIA
jgi:uncharacterized protein YciI